MVEQLNDYECGIRYHSGEENVVADVFSRKEHIKPCLVWGLTMTIHSNLTAQI